MERTNNTNSNECACKNNYDETTFLESFGKDDDEIKNCNSCQYMDFDCGIMTCKKFK